MKIKDGLTNRVHLANDRYMILCESCVESPEIVPLSTEVTCKKCQAIIDRERKVVNFYRNKEKP